eukprot:CAMPEP_0198249560 /NCGR_PEP_ID=MMETSP1447-20131203/1054_1 /TAXON_ID=420782 /ORGANISM="Chaetoceros dichaeta, Strain CCMP1751" /LENGTH=244 /DNA_ID=CAMNT_0043934231 /DNA_START=111 /DNA_END=845 /DNA_ORIENTATION=+
MAIIPTAAFVTPIPCKPLTHGTCSPTTISMSNSPDDDNRAAPPMLHKIAATAALAGACILSNVFTANVAFAMDDVAQFDFGPTSTIIAGRGGGGRGGGRAMGGGGMSRGGGGMSRGGGAAYARPSGGGGNVYRSRTYISAPPVVVSPFGMGMGYGYNPLGGMGLGYGLGAASNIGNQMTDNRQEGEIQNSRIELEQAKFKAAQLEARLEQLEKGSAGGQTQALPPVQALQQVAPVQAQPPALAQ